MSENLPAALGALPQSSALAEASPAESLSDLMSRDPEGFTAKDLDRMVEVFRAQRQKFDQMEAEGKEKKARQPKLTGGGLKSLTSQKSAEDLGL